MFDAVIRSRGVILDEFAAAHRRASTSSDPEVVSLMAAATVSRQRFANLVVRSLQDPVSRTLLEEARKQKDEAERALAERNVEARAELSRVSVGLDEVRKALPSDTALVSFVRDERRALLRRASQSVVRSPGLIRSVHRRSGRPVTLVPLGSAVELDAHIRSWRKEASGQSCCRRITGASRSELPRSVHSFASNHLGSVDPYVVGASRVFVVPDGLLNL